MIYCIHCQKDIRAVTALAKGEDDLYIHNETNSPFCDAPSLDAARENGFRIARPQARPDPKRVTLDTMREMAPIRNTVGDLDLYDRERDDAYGEKLDRLFD